MPELLFNFAEPTAVEAWHAIDDRVMGGRQPDTSASEREVPMPSFPRTALWGAPTSSRSAGTDPEPTSIALNSRT
jgi:hypothetical protein